MLEHCSRPRRQSEIGWPKPGRFTKWALERCVSARRAWRARVEPALKLRETLNDDAGAAASRRNLSFVFAPVTNIHPARRRCATIARSRFVPFRDGIQPAVPLPKTKVSAGDGVPVGGPERSRLLGCARRVIVAIGTLQISPRPLDRRRRNTGERSDYATAASVAGARDDQALFPPVPRRHRTDRANILIFTPRPGSIAMGGSTKLCYAVSGACKCKSNPARRRQCDEQVDLSSRCAGSAPTTYELTAHGRDGQPVRQQLVIVVP